MLFSRASCLLALTTLACAAPYEKAVAEGQRRRDASADSERRGFVGDIISHLSNFSRLISNCKPQGELPQSNEPLPAPSEGLSLYHIAVGRGTQNYTCDLNNATAVPVAAGAVANLYDVDCYAGYGMLSDHITTCALNDQSYPSSAPSSPWSPLMGHHYFTDATTAYFNLDTLDQQWGQGGFQKIASVSAPSESTTGRVGGSDFNGAVPWLKLQTKDAGQCPTQEIYRVRTAGGNPPSTCDDYRQKGQSTFEIQYSAEYWFYAKAE